MRFRTCRWGSHSSVLEDGNILIVCHPWSPVAAFIFISNSFTPPAHQSLWYHLFLTLWQFPYLFVSVSPTSAPIHSLRMSDGLTKCCNGRQLLALALIPSFCLRNEFHDFIYSQVAYITVFSFWADSTPSDRESQYTVTSKLSNPVIFRVIWVVVS